MLVLNNRANFSKKASGKIIFNCDAKQLINKAFKRILDGEKTQTFWLTSKGIDQQGNTVSTFEFEWTLLLKE
jgi:hypothetical protein